MATLKTGDRVIAYTEKTSVRARRLTITVSGGKVTVTFPKGISKREIRRFVESRADWIWQCLQEQQNKAMEKACRLTNGFELSLKGECLRLKVLRYDGRLIKVQRRGNELCVFLPLFCPETEEATNIRFVLKKWYRDQARRVFLEKMMRFAPEMGVNFQQLRVREQKSRWGSCSAQGNINLNWKAVLAPERIIDYIIIHELAHLKHLNHSPDFWRLVAEHSPEYRECRLWLRRYGNTLDI
jgi:predicted metal-dependent hydrolase